MPGSVVHARVASEPRTPDTAPTARTRSVAVFFRWHVPAASLYVHAAHAASAAQNVQHWPAPPQSLDAFKNKYVSSLYCASGSSTHEDWRM